MHNEEEILAQLRAVLQELFEIEPAEVSLETNLNEDLDIDSIDAIDLVVKLKEITGKKIQPEAFKNVRTVGDVVVAIQALEQDAATV